VALSTFPPGAAATRFRVFQYVSRVADAGIHVRLLPFLSEAALRHLYDRRKIAETSLRIVSAMLRRLLQLPRILRADVLLVQREAMLFGPPWVEWLATRVAKVPMVLDLDDATWIPVTSPIYGRLATVLKWPSKTGRLIRWAHTVICGNEMIAEHVRSFGVRAEVMPTIVDTSVFRPRTGGAHEIPVVGWIGTHTTWTFVEPLLPILEEIGRSIPFRLRIVGSGRASLTLPGIEVDLLPWSLDREVHDFQTIDIGLYPLANNQWTVGKSGLKIIQYFASGVASIASPVGIVREIGTAGVTHLEASTPDAWRESLERLLRDATARHAMAVAGRAYAVEHYSVAEFASRIAGVLHGARTGHSEVAS